MCVGARIQKIFTGVSEKEKRKRGGCVCKKQAGLAQRRLIADLSIVPCAAGFGLAACSRAVRRSALSRTLCPEAPSKGNYRGRLCRPASGCSGSIDRAAPALGTRW